LKIQGNAHTVDQALALVNERWLVISLLTNCRARSREE